MAKKYRQGESGVALVEGSIVIPLFIIIIAIIVDCGIMLNQYFILSRISYTASRMASEYPQLEQGVFEDLDFQTGGNLAHYGLQTRIRQVVAAYGTKLKSPIEVTTIIESDSRLIDMNGAMGQPKQVNEPQDPPVEFNGEIARVVLRMQYNTFWSRIIGVVSLPISVDSEGAYLLKSNV